VIDSGVAYDHPDLQNNVWTNPNEIKDNGIDDDGNDYIDDVHGWDFVNDDNNPSDYSKDLYSDGHGTHVAGTIAAEGNNTIGITGVMWKAQIMPLQIFDLFKTNSFLSAIIQEFNIINAIIYAVNNKAKIINCSFGSGANSQFIYDAINYANQNGVLIIVSAGNDTNDNDINPKFPSNYNLPNIISVAATNGSDELAVYSNYGFQTVDVAAPGGDIIGNIYSTTPPERVILFYDDFESGGSKWVTYGIYETWYIDYDPIFNSNVVTDSFGYYHENENSYFRTANLINAENCRGIHLQFDIDYSLEDEYDFLFIEGSPDDINYTAAYYATGFSSGISHFLDWESELELGKFYLRFRLITDYLNNYDGVYIDNFYLTGIPWTFDGDEYDYKSGTSMAAPIVTGIAGLIWSLNPTLTHLEVKNIILESVDELDSLNGKVSTGGRVNAYKAVFQTSPPLTDDTDETEDDGEEEETHASNEVTLTAYGSQEEITIVASDATTLSNCEAIDNPSPSDTPAGVSFPYGFFNFTIDGVGAGGHYKVTMTLPAGANPSSYYKFGPTPDDPSNHWYEFLYDGETGAVINGNIITLYFVNGKRGDNDLNNTNGSIVDPGGPSTDTSTPAEAPSSDDGGDFGCYIGSLTQ